MVREPPESGSAPDQNYLKGLHNRKVQRKFDETRAPDDPERQPAGPLVQPAHHDLSPVIERTS